MDSKCPQRNRKKDEKDSGKNKSTNSAFADIPSGKQSSSTQQTLFSNPKKDQDHQQGGSRRRRGRREQGCGRNSPTTGANANAVKREERDLSQVEYFTCHRKGYYSNKCPHNLNPKRESKN